MPAQKKLPPDHSLRLLISDAADPKKWWDVSGWQSWTIIDDWQGGIPQFTAVPAATQQMRDIIGPHSQRVRVYADTDAFQFDGLTDERSRDTEIGSTTMDITGRGVAGQLVDCSIPPKWDGQDLHNLAGLTLFQVGGRVTSPWQPDIIKSVAMDAGPARYLVSGGNRKRSTPTNGVPGYWDPVQAQKGVLVWVDARQPVRGSAHGKKSPQYRGIDRDQLRQLRIEPGETPWGVLTRLAAQVRAHVWSTCDGTVIIGMPCYQMDPKAAYGRGIFLRWDKAAGTAVESNVSGVQVETGGAERFSHYECWGVAKPNKKSKGKELLPDGYTVNDPSPGFWRRSATPPYLAKNLLYRPKTIEVKGLADPKLIRRIAMYEMERAAIAGISIEYELPGHHAPNGALWTSDSMVEVYDELNDLYGPHFITRVERRYQGIGKQPKGKTTLLKMIPPDVYLPTKLGDGSDFDPDAISDDAYLQHMIHRVWW